MPSTVKEKMLYIMGIDWNWIYQRPQILAEKLNQDYDVTVVFPRKIYKAPPVSEGRNPVKKKWLPVLPLQEKNRFIGKISQWIYRKLLWDYQEYWTVKSFIKKNNPFMAICGIFKLQHC